MIIDLSPVACTQYVVALCESDLPAPARINAEVRFAVEIERLLGGGDMVAYALQEWLKIRAAASGSDAAFLAVWPAAVERATFIACAGNECGRDAYFEVRAEPGVSPVRRKVPAA